VKITAFGFRTTRISNHDLTLLLAHRLIDPCPEIAANSHCNLQ